MTTTQHRASSANAEFEQFFAKRSEAAAAYVNGDPAPLDALVPHSGEATFHSPRGDSVSGADAVSTRYRIDAATFASGGRSRFEILQQEISGDLAFWTGFQVASVRMKDHKEPIEMRIRVTEVFRRTDGHWQLVHRHADTSGA